MNILDAEDMIKGLPDQALMQEAQMPSGQMPQFLVVSEIQRRSDMRKRYQAQQQEAMPSVKDQIVQEGIMGMMPQQPMGMPPQGMPQGMPPMGMAQGGIARMANGGSTSMPGAGALMGAQIEYIDPLLEQAKILAQTTGRSIEEAYEALKREAQMNMPDYSMIAPAGMGQMPALPSPPAGMRPPRAVPGGIDVGAMSDIGSAVGRLDMGMPTREQAMAGDRARVESIRSSLSPSITSDDIDDAVAGMVTERAPRSGGFSGITSLFSDIAEGARGIPDYLSGMAEELGITGVDRDAMRRSRIEKNLENQTIGTMPMSPEMTAALDLADSQVDMLDAADDARLEQIRSKPGVGPIPPVDEVIEEVQETYTDASDPDYKMLTEAFDGLGGKAGGKEVQSTSSIQKQSLGLEDLISDSRRMAQANALMQLGAGIAGGDLSKGISAAGVAASKGMQDARTLEMRKRLAEYQAGRQDLAREEKARQFEKTFGLSERRVDALIEQNASTTQRERLRTLVSLYENELDETKRSGLQRQIQQLLAELGGQPMVVDGMQAGAVSFTDLARG